MVDFKTLNKEEEQVKKEGGTTIGSATRILIFKSEPRYPINELPQLPRARL
jgi:hypothetical protein